MEVDEYIPIWVILQDVQLYSIRDEEESLCILLMINHEVEMAQSTDDIQSQLRLRGIQLIFQGREWDNREILMLSGD